MKLGRKGKAHYPDMCAFCIMSLILVVVSVALWGGEDASLHLFAAKAHTQCTRRYLDNPLVELLQLGHFHTCT
jgi:hypothetical protein